MVFLIVVTLAVSVTPLVWCSLHCHSFLKTKNYWELLTIVIFLIGTIYIGFQWSMVVSNSEGGYDVWRYLNILRVAIVVIAIGGFARLVLLLTNRIRRKPSSTSPFGRGTTKKY
jgi:hypothetical protein